MMVTSSLTPADVTVIQRLTNRRTRWSRGWPYMRYAVLIMALGMIGMSAWIHCIVLNILDSDPSFAAAPLETKPVTTDALNFALLSVRNHINAVMSWTGAIALFAIGMWLVGFTWSQWHRHEEDRALQRLLDAMLASLAPNSQESP